FQSLGVEVTNNNYEVVEQREIVVVAVKPNVVQTVLQQVSPIVTPENLIVSVAAGVPLGIMEKCLPWKSRVVRVMPNIPTLIRQGASAFALGNHVTERDRDIVKEIMSAVGYVEEVQEKDVAAVTGLSGSGPAYCFMAIEALADGGVKAGLSRQQALKLAAHTVEGSARLVLESGKHPGELKDAVCSPQGSTIYAVHALEKAGVRATLMDAVESAIERAKQLSEQ
ncbi:pyrroline-5-carboxylate reductase, partial [Exaiptasia diaphana]|uniref:pyrroline-5-carboxylate reductase n=1 Tax=Exaiptasia diaphana TaxID=2652724 RepID=A0A913YNI9_EXADI